MKAEWEVHKNGLRYVLAKRVSEWAMGSGYRWHRSETGKVKRFWRRKSAQQLADRMNYAAERLP
jgi:hypothetical protein